MALTNPSGPHLTMDLRAAYEIRVPGHLDAYSAEWLGEMALAAETNASDRPITILTGALDQAALLGLLRRLNARGIPLIAVTCLDAT